MSRICYAAKSLIPSINPKPQSVILEPMLHSVDKATVKWPKYFLVARMINVSYECLQNICLHVGQ